MAMMREHLLTSLTALLKPEEVKDYCPNGLQVEGKSTIEKIVTGVTASQALIDRAIQAQADAIIVHHGYFWKGEAPAICGMKQRRIKALLQHDINLIAFHLPLDIHPEVGNNARLGQVMGLSNVQPLETVKPTGIVYRGEIGPLDPQDFADRLTIALGRSVSLEKCTPSINNVAWCTGGGQGYIEEAVAAGADAFVTGEVSEQTIHIAREMEISFFSAGHHATERYGIQALGEWIAQNHSVSVEFIDIPNPA